MAAITSALIAGGAALGGAALASNAANRQSQAITQSTDAANALQREQWQQSRQDMLPWLQSGTAALGEINRRLGLNVQLTGASGTPIVGGQTGSGSGGQFGVGGGSQSGGNQPGVVQQLFNTATQGGMNPGVNTLPTPPFPGSDVAQLSGQGSLGGSPGNPLGAVGMGGEPKAQTMTGQPLVAGGPNLTPGTPVAGTDQPLINGGPNVQTMTGTPTGSGTPPANPSDPQNRYGGFYASPGYQFRMDEGERQLRANAAARGMLQSGDFAQALIRYGQDYASNEFNNQLNQLFSVAGLGQSAVGTTGAQGLQYATNAGNNLLTAGNARASSYGTGANAWGNALGAIGGLAYNYPWGK